MTNSTTTTDTLIGGRVTLVQPAKGYRVAIDPVLLAASIPAAPGDTVLDVGAGTGAVSLCLAHRCPGVQITGLEREADFHAMAVESAALNGFSINLVQGDLFKLPDALAGRQFDQVVTNPPYWSADSSRPPATNRRAAHFLDGHTLADWLAACAGLVKSGGRLSMILPAEKRAEALAALAGHCDAVVQIPLLPRQGRAPKRLILQAVVGGAPTQEEAPGLVLHESLVLHETDGSYTQDAQDILERGRALKPA